MRRFRSRGQMEANRRFERRQRVLFAFVLLAFAVLVVLVGAYIVWLVSK